MSDHADERRDVRLWDDGYTVGQQAEWERVQAALRAIYAGRTRFGCEDDMFLVERVAATLGMTLEEEGGE